MLLWCTKHFTTHVLKDIWLLSEPQVRQGQMGACHMGERKMVKVKCLLSITECYMERELEEAKQKIKLLRLSS